MNPKVPFSFREAEPGPCSDFHINHHQAFVSSPNCAPVLRVHLTNLKSRICLDDEKYSPAGETLREDGAHKSEMTNENNQLLLFKILYFVFFFWGGWGRRRMFKGVWEKINTSKCDQQVFLSTGRKIRG